MKIAIICSDFRKSNIRKFPWRYIYENAKYLLKKHDIVVITDTKSDISDLRVVNIKKIFEIGNGETKELLQTLKLEAPDKCIMLLGVTSFLRRKFQIKIPVYGVFTSPPYTIGELIKNVGLKNSLKYHNYMLIHYLNSLIPNYFIKKWSPKFEKIFFLSEYTLQRIVEKGCPNEKCVFIPVGVEKHFLALPEINAVKKIKSEINPDLQPIILYFTSPLTLRGTDTLTKAFSQLRLEKECKLIFLSRIDSNELYSEEKYIKTIAERAGVYDSIEIISEYLNPQEIKNYLSVADIVCLPFKIVISDVPVSILEAISMGKPVISTNVSCIPKLVDGRGLVVSANNESELKNALKRLLDNPELIKDLTSNGKKFIENHPDWNDVGDLLEAALGE